MAKLRSPTGASAALLEAALDGKVTLLANVALMLEYEAVCLPPEHLEASGLSPDDVEVVFDAVAAIAEPVESHYVWGPCLRDPGDEMVLEAAVNGRADVIATFNASDFDAAPREFGIQVLLPRDVMRMLR